MSDALEELHGIIQREHGEFCMSMSCNCDEEARREAEALYDRIRNSE